MIVNRQYPASNEGLLIERFFAPMYSRLNQAQCRISYHLCGNHVI